MLNVSGVICAMGAARQPPEAGLSQIGWTRCEEMRPQKRGTVHDMPADGLQMDRVRLRGMSSHMCLNMDPGGRIDAVL